MKKSIKIGTHILCKDSPTYIVAEMSGNHNMSYERALKIIDAAADAGADAIKLQTYTADTITIDCNSEYFQIKQGTIWDGTTLYELYKSAYTPWEWQPGLKEYAESRGLDFFSTPFDFTSVDFLEKLDIPAYKIASFEINDIPLIRKVAKLGKPVIIATGIAKLADIELAVSTCIEEGNDQIILMKCTSEYPTKYENMNLKTISSMKETFDCLVGLSDHSMGYTADIVAVSLGAKIIEKHLTISRTDGGPDCDFSMEKDEFKMMVDAIRTAEKSIGKITYDLSVPQIREREHSRSLFVTKDIKVGEIFTAENIKSIRPGFGLHTKHYEEILGLRARVDLKCGTPLDWKYIE